MRASFKVGDDRQTRLRRSIARFAERATRRSSKRSRTGSTSFTLGKREMNSRAYVSRFNFSGTDQQKRVGQLSGGERNRVHLAKMLKSGANVILLDEPTNDLDVNTMRALEEALENFAGCAVVISHDRWFLDRIATHILAFEGDSATSSISTATTANTKPTANAASASTPTSRIGSNTAV